MKKLFLVMPILALVLLSACSRTSEESSSNINNSASTQISPNVSSTSKLVKSSDTVDVKPSSSSTPSSLSSDNSILGAMQALKSVLLNEESLFYEDNMADRLPMYNGYLKDIKINESPMEIPQFAIIDLDGDDIPEVVLAIKNYHGFVILKYKINRVIGNYIPYRAFAQLKKDGSFLSSSGADNNIIGKMYFIGDTIFPEDKYKSSGDSYFLRDIPIEKETWDKQWDSFGDLPEVDWFNYNEDEIKQQFTSNSNSENVPESVKVSMNERQEYLDSLSYLMELTNSTGKSQKEKNADAKKYYDGCNEQRKKIYDLCLKKSSGDDLQTLKKEQEQWENSFNSILSDYLSSNHVNSIDELEDQYFYFDLGDMFLRRTINLVNRYYDYHFYD